MKNINVGIANLIISEKLKNTYFNDSINEESKKTAIDFFKVLKNSPILQLEFKVFNNIENKHIENDIIATRYIDNNIKLFEVFTIEEIDNERERIKSLITETKPIFDEKYNGKLKLYNSIDSLIKESISDYNDIDVDELHESFSFVLNHIKSPKEKIIENINDIELIDDYVIETAINIFNSKYESLNEEEKDLIQKITKSTEKEKFELFESYKKETIELLSNLKINEDNQNIDKAINKINKMIYESYDIKIDDDIVNLYELKRELI